jgi:hypothetical protein
VNFQKQQSIENKRESQRVPNHPGKHAVQLEGFVHDEHPDRQIAAQKGNHIIQKIRGKYNPFPQNTNECCKCFPSIQSCRDIGQATNNIRSRHCNPPHTQLQAFIVIHSLTVLTL